MNLLYISAYEESITCLEDKKKELSLWDRFIEKDCAEKIDKLIDIKKEKYHGLTGERL